MDELRNQIEQFANTIEQLENRVRVIEDEPKNDKFEINDLLSNIQRDYLNVINTDRILESVWNDYIYIIPTLVDIDRYLVSLNATGNAIYDNTGLVLTTGATNGAWSEVSLSADSSFITRTRETRFRVIAKVDSVADIDAIAATLGVSETNNMGFEFLNGALYGFCVNNASTVTTVSLSSYSADTFYDLELLFTVNGIKFFINGIEKGAITDPSLMPSGTTGIKIFDVYILNAAAATKTLTVSLAEFVQRKK